MFESFRIFDSCERCAQPITYYADLKAWGTTIGRNVECYGTETCGLQR